MMRVDIVVDSRKVKKSAATPCRGCVGEFSPPLCAYLGTPADCADHIFIVTDAKKMASPAKGKSHG